MPRYCDTLSQGIQTGFKSQLKKSMSLRLADSEQQEICAAFEKTKEALRLAREATEALQGILERRIACVSEKHMQELRKESGRIGNGLFRLNVQQCIVGQYGVDRVLD